MILLSADRIAKAVAINQLQKMAPIRRLKEVTGRHRGGNRWWHGSDEEAYAFIGEVYRLLSPFAGDLSGKVGVEIGPGDNIGVAYCFLLGGCRKMFAVERISSAVIDGRTVTRLRGLEQRYPGGASPGAPILRREGGRYLLDPERLEFKQCAFEDLTLDEPVDFIYSNDVMEHVDDPAVVLRAAHRLLKPGGVFINNVDFAGHNAFKKSARPLDYLTCTDWLWHLMFSNLVSTNRVRYGELISAAQATGFRVRHVEVLDRADPEYLAELRAHLLPRFRDLPDEDLGVVQCVLVLEK